MSEKLFTVAGYSTKDGKTKARFATDMTRVKTLVKTGHTDIQLQDLPKPMTKEDAIAFIGGKSQVGALTINKGPALVADINKAKSKAPKLKIVKTAKPKQTKEVPAAEIIEQVGLVVAKNGAPTTKSMEEIAKIKAKNLETMRKVTNKLSALREF